MYRYSTAVTYHRTSPSRALPDQPDAEMTPDVKTMFAQFKRVHVHDCTDDRPWSHKELAMAIVEQWEQGKSMTILNTKRDALLVYREFGNADYAYSAPEY